MAATKNFNHEDESLASESSSFEATSSTTNGRSSIKTLIETSPIVQKPIIVTESNADVFIQPRIALNNRKRRQDQAAEMSSESTNTTYSKSYKFGLSNHFLTMPHHFEDKPQLDRNFKYYQQERTGRASTSIDTTKLSRNEYRKVMKNHSSKDGNESRKNRAINAKTQASVDKYLRSISLANQEADIDNYQENGGNEGDRCDLSVMALSSVGALSLSIESTDDETGAGAQQASSTQMIPSRRLRGHEDKHHDLISPQTKPQSDSSCLNELSTHSTNENSQTSANLKAIRSDDCQYFSKPTSPANYTQLESGVVNQQPISNLMPKDNGLECRENKQPTSKTVNDYGESECASNSVLIRFSSIMYATFLVVLGCILHVSELKQQSKNSSDHIYTTVVALIGICWLLFLQGDLQRYKKYASKYILIESMFNDQIKLQQHNHMASTGGEVYKLQEPSHDPTARSTSSSSASLVNDRMSLSTEVIFKKTAYKMYEQQRRHQQANNNPKAFDLTAARVATSVVSPRQRMSECCGAGGEMIPAYKFLHGKMGANFYLKCGMAAFCFGSVIHEGLRFGQQLYFFTTGNVHCRDLAALIAHLVTPLYSFYQLFMIFKYSNLVINRHKILARFGLMHIIGTCATFWFRTILEEAFEDFVHKMDYFKTQNKPISIEAMFTHQPSSSLMPGQQQLAQSSFADLLLNSLNPSETIRMAVASQQATNLSSFMQPTSNLNSNQTSLATSTLLALMSSPMSATITPQLVRQLPDSYACAQNTLLTTKSMNALPYLYPFTIEYNLLIAATFLSLYFNIGKIGNFPASMNCSQLLNKSTSNAPMMAQQGNIIMPSQASNHNGRRWTSGASFSSLLAQSFDLRSGSDSSSSASGAAAAVFRHPTEASVLGSSINQQRRHHNYAEDKHPGEYKSNFVVNADCHAANKGLFCGFFVLLVTLVTIVIFFVTINKPSHVQLGIKINLIQEVVLTSLILIVTLSAFKQIVRLNRNANLKDKVSTDDVLMLIPLPFFFIHSLLSFRAETASLYTSTIANSSQQQQQLQSGLSLLQQQQPSLLNSTGRIDGVSSSSQLNRILLSLPTSQGPQIRRDNSMQRQNQSIAASSQTKPNTSSTVASGGNIDNFKLLTVALNLGVMIEVLVQTNFIIDGLRRCSESRYLRFKKPGRELITFAILLNITYWIVATFETKSVEQYKTEIEYYGPLPYMFISHTTLPVMLFYRYHSSVCLAEIWNRAYKPAK